MKINYQQKSHGKCKACGDDKQEFKGIYAKAKFYKVFEEISYFRGDDYYLGTFCKKCFKAKLYGEEKV